MYSANKCHIPKRSLVKLHVVEAFILYTTPPCKHFLILADFCQLKTFHRHIALWVLLKHTCATVNTKVRWICKIQSQPVEWNLIDAIPMRTEVAFTNRLKHSHIGKIYEFAFDWHLFFDFVVYDEFIKESYYASVLQASMKRINYWTLSSDSHVFLHKGKKGPCTRIEAH